MNTKKSHNYNIISSAASLGAKPSMEPDEKKLLEVFRYNSISLHPFGTLSALSVPHFYDTTILVTLDPYGVFLDHRTIGHP